MTRTRLCAAALLAAAALGTALAQDRPDVAPAPRAGVDLTGYKTVAQLTLANPKEFNVAGTAAATTAGFLGVVIGDQNGKPVVEVVAPGSPAETAGVKDGDVVLKVGTDAVTTAAAAREILRVKTAGEVVKLTVRRGGETVEATAKLKAVSSPMTPSAVRLGLGFTPARGPGATPAANGVRVGEVVSGGPAAQAGIKTGDVITKIDGKPVDADTYRDALSDRKAGDRVDVEYERDGKPTEVKAFVAPEDRPGGKFGPGGGAGGAGAGGWDDRLPRAWRRPDYKLVIIGVEYPDVKHNPKITDSDWEDSMFSRGLYTNKSATGYPVYGSLADYYQAISYGNLRVEGKFGGWVQMSKKRMEYSTGSGTSGKEKSQYFNEAMDKYLAAAGKDALKGVDGIFFLYAGGSTGTTRGSLYWPHRSNFTYQGQSWPYFIVQEGGERMQDISVFCHEFGHMLGLPDLYARPEVPGMEGVGSWCAMSQQGRGGRPQQFSAWCKEQLGWIKPAVIDPRVKQNVVLAPLADDPTQCVKVMMKQDGSEYLLLENRQRKGWDTSLPADGLLIWRVTPGNQTQKVFLEEAHGIEGPSGPRTFTGAVPYPSPANNSFTPFTTPSSKSVTGGGLPVYVTNVRRLPDGRVTFQIGYEYQ